MAEYALQLSEAEVARYQLMAERARVAEADLWQAAGIVAGARVADVGCGPGATLLVMAQIVGNAGAVVGVDGDPDAVQTAQELIRRSGVGHASARVGSADDTGLEPGSVDVAVMRHVLAHNGGREQAIVDHLARLVRPGGRVYLVDVDLTAFRTLDADPETLQMMERYVSFHRGRGNDPQVGLRLGQLMERAGLEVLQHEGTFDVLTVPPGMRPPAWAAREAMQAEGHASAEEVARWGVALERLDRLAVRPVAFLSRFWALGRRSA